MLDSHLVDAAVTAQFALSARYSLSLPIGNSVGRIEPREFQSKP